MVFKSRTDIQVKQFLVDAERLAVDYKDLCNRVFNYWLRWYLTDSQNKMLETTKDKYKDR